MLGAIFCGHRINHGALVAKCSAKSTSILKGLELFANAILRLSASNRREISRILEAKLLGWGFKLGGHALSPCYVLQISKIAESCNRK